MLRTRERVHRKSAAPSRASTTAAVTDSDQQPDPAVAPVAQSRTPTASAGGHSLTQYAIALQPAMPSAAASPASPSAAASGTSPSVPGWSETFNPESIVHDLRRAIDQSEVTLDWDKGPIRKIDAALVIRVLDNLTATEVKAITTLYESQEKRGGSLLEDLFGGGTSGVPGSLTRDQEARIRALLRGTRADEPGAAATTARIEAAAVELHELLGGKLKDEKQERVMALHRRPVNEIGRIDAYYLGFYGKSLADTVFDKFENLQLKRMLALRAGDWIRADACAIEDRRQAIAKLDAQPPVPWEIEENAEKRKKLLGGIESIVEQNRQEAMADPNNVGKTAAQIAQERIGAIVGTRVGDDAPSLGESLQTTLKSQGRAIVEMGNGSLADAAARRLLAMEESETTRTDKITPLLKGFRSQAEHDIMAAFYGQQVSQAEKQAILSDPALLQSAIDALAKRYTAAFVDAYDGMRGDHRSWREIVASADDYNQDLLNALKEGGGRIEDQVVELDIAIRKRDVEGIKAILARQPDKAAVDKLAADYEATHHVNLRSVLFGHLGEEAAATVDTMFTHAILSGRSAAAAQESLDKPATLNSVEEVEWIARHGRRERGVTEANSGAMGALREIGDDPETQVLMAESARRLTELEAEWKANLPGGRPKQVILAEMRRVRTTLTGDATAYEEDNARMVAELRSAVSFGVQIALAVALPGFPSNLLATMALNISANVASNMVIWGDQYTLDSFRNDVLGGVLGGVGGKFGEEIAGTIASQVTGTAAKATVEAAEHVGLTVALARESGAAATMASEASLAMKTIREAGSLTGATAGTTIATGENQFTAEGIITGVVMNRLGALRGQPHAAAASGESAPPVVGERSHPPATVEPRAPEMTPMTMSPSVVTPVDPLSPASLTGMRIETHGQPTGEMGTFSHDDIHGWGEGIETNAGSDTFFEMPGQNPRTGGGLQDIATAHGAPGQIALNINHYLTDVATPRIADASGVSMRGEVMQPDGTQNFSILPPGAGGTPANEPVPRTYISNANDVWAPGMQQNVELRYHSENPNAPAGSYSRSEPTVQVNTPADRFGWLGDRSLNVEGQAGRYLLPDGRWIEMRGAPEPDRAAAHWPVGRSAPGGSEPGTTPPGPGGAPPPLPPPPAPRATGRPDPDSPEMQRALGDAIDGALHALDSLGTTHPSPSEYYIFEADAKRPDESASAAKVVPEEPIAPDRLRDTYGMPEANQVKFQQIAEKYGVEIDVRPTKPDASRLLEEGAVPKMEDLKSKTIDPIDIYLGVRPGDVGKVGFFKPEPPQRPSGMDDTVWKRVVERFTQREGEYWDYSKRMTELQRSTEMQRDKSGPTDERGTHREHQIVVGEDGVVRAVTDDDILPERPFTGDHDVYDIRKADGSPLSREEYDTIVQEMKAAEMGVAHGAHVWWTPVTPVEIAIFESIKRRHESGTEPLIRFSPNRQPVTAAPK